MKTMRIGTDRKKIFSCDRLFYFVFYLKNISILIFEKYLNSYCLNKFTNEKVTSVRNLCIRQ